MFHPDGLLGELWGDHTRGQPGCSRECRKEIELAFAEALAWLAVATPVPGTADPHLRTYQRNKSRLDRPLTSFPAVFMKTIVITSQKGGSGRTTLAAHLAVEAERTGDAPAWLIDTDKQGTLSLWHERRETDTPQRADVPFVRLAGGLEALAGRGAAYCFIDTAPTISYIARLGSRQIT
jgi:Mrp family chromosome partitioning ATPase